MKKTMKKSLVICLALALMIPMFASVIPAMAATTTGVYTVDESYPNRDQVLPTKIAEGATAPTYQMTIETPDGAGPFPVVMYIHGGGWQYNLMGFEAYFFGNTKAALLKAGFAIVSVTYTLSSEKVPGAPPSEDSLTSGYPQMIYDVKAAVRAIRANADKYNLDADFIAAMGDSAGGHLSSLLATTNGNPAYEDLTMGNATFSSDVQAVVSYYGPQYYDFENHEYKNVNTSDEIADEASGMTWLEMAKYNDMLLAYALLGSAGYQNHEMQIAGSPFHQLTADAPPMYFLYGGKDPLINVDHNTLMIEKYKQLVGEETLQVKYFPDGVHGDMAGNALTYDTVETAASVVAFLVKQAGIDVNPFSDVQASAWYYDAVMTAYKAGVMKGDGTLFDPNGNLTRAMMVQILYNYGGSAPSAKAPFDDVNSEWFANPVAWAYENDIVSGYGDGKFGPNDAVTREQMALILYNFCEYKGITLPVVKQSGSFADAGSISSWATEAVQAMHQAGILNGKTGGIFDPQGTATRAEVAQMMVNFLGVI